jgi:hypothetical protein
MISKKNAKSFHLHIKTNAKKRNEKKNDKSFICILKPMQNFKTNAKKRNQISHFIKITKDFEKLLHFKYTFIRRI